MPRPIGGFDSTEAASPTGLGARTATAICQTSSCAPKESGMLRERRKTVMRLATENDGSGLREGFRLAISMRFRAGYPSCATGGTLVGGIFRTEGVRLTRCGAEIRVPPGGKTAGERSPQISAICESAKKRAAGRRAAERSKKRKSEVCSEAEATQKERCCRSS